MKFEKLEHGEIDSKAYEAWQDHNFRVCGNSGATVFFRSTGLLQAFGHLHQPGERRPLRDFGAQAR